MLSVSNNTIAKLNKYKNCFKDLFFLSLPILIGELGHTLIGATDVLVVAKYDIHSLAAVSIANSLLFTIFILGLGIIDAIPIVLSKYRGEKKRVKHHFWGSIVFSFIVSIIFAFLCYSTVFIVDKMGFEVTLLPLIKQYLTIVSFSMFGMFIYQGIKCFLLTYEIVKFPNLILLGAVIVNLIFDIIFVLGFGPFPAMGVKGAAIATLSVRTLMAVVIFIYAFKFINFRSPIDFSFLKRVIKIGIPIGVALMIEFFAFNIITILVGRESGLLAATHNILITIGSATFMVPLSISIALSVKVSFFFGAKKIEELKNYVSTALIFGVGFMILVSLLLILFPTQIIGLFTTNKEVLAISIPIIIVVSVYQVFDGIQVIMGGVLKGFQMTKTVSTTVLLCYWALGMPIAFILVGKYSMSLKGYWIALAVSLFAMSILMSIFSVIKYKRFKASI